MPTRKTTIIENVAVPTGQVNYLELNNSVIRLETKMDQMGLDVKDLKEGTLTRLTRLEAWKEQVDNYHALVNYDKLIPLINWTTSYKANWKWIIALIGFIFASFGAFISYLLSKLFHF